MRVTTATIRGKKRKGEKIAMITAYDYVNAKLVDEHVDMILVGDSLAMVMLGHESTIPVTMEDMLLHTASVVRGTEHALVVGDMPFMSYQVSVEEAMHNAGRFLKEAGAQAVKLEGGTAMAPLVARLVQIGIPVVGHVGLTPQSVYQLGGYRMQGKTIEGAKQLLSDAKALNDAGVFALVLECVPAELARMVTEHVTCPTIGIGAGPWCDGQVQVITDMLGMTPDFLPRHAKRYADLGQAIRAAVQHYAEDVRSGSFPTSENWVSMDESYVEDLRLYA